MRTLSQRNSLLLRLNENKRGSVPPNVIGCDTKKQLALYSWKACSSFFFRILDPTDPRFLADLSTFYATSWFFRLFDSATTFDFRRILRNSLPILLFRRRASTTCLQGRIAQRDMKNERKKKYVDCIVGSCNDAVARTRFVIIWITDFELRISMIYNQFFCTNRR